VLERERERDRERETEREREKLATAWPAAAYSNCRKHLEHELLHESSFSEVESVLHAKSGLVLVTGSKTFEVLVLEN
jgi:hypothetical protein